MTNTAKQDKGPSQSIPVRLLCITLELEGTFPLKPLLAAVMLTPPAPPLFSARTVLSASAHSAADLPRRFRRPLLHCMLLFANEAAHLFSYAQDVLFAFASRGIDVFLQTDVSDAHSGHHPIALEDVDDIIAHSRAEFFVLITERDISRQTVQVRVGSQYVERDIEKHAAIILETWASAIARDQTQLLHVSLGRNPNIVTSKHIDFLLQQHPLLQGIRSAYATLARLVDSTQKWLEDHNEPHSFGSPLPIAPPGQVVSGTDSDYVEKKPEESSEPSMSAARNASQTASHTLSKKDMDELAKEALRQGLCAVLAQNDGTSESDDVLSKSTPSIRWLRRSHRVSARLLRGQFLVQSLHSRLLETFPVIASAPVVSQSEPSQHVYSVPSEVHRQRLLREINFLVARMEELGSRLSRRPKTRRRRRMSSPVNPWTSYINQTRGAATHPVGIAALSSFGKNGRESEHSDTWRCTGCHSINARSLSNCRCCKASSCVLGSGIIPDVSESMANRVRDAIKAASRQRRPWIFAPAPMPIPPSGTGPASVLGGIGRRPENVPFGMGPLPGAKSDPLRVPQQRSHDSFLPQGHRLSPDLLDAFKAISVDDVGRNGLTPRSRLYEARSLDTGRGPLSNMQNFPLPNGHGMSNVNAIPISRSPNHIDSSPPIRSPEGLEYRAFPRMMPRSDQRSASLDANLLGNSLGRLPSDQWFSEKQGSREIPLHGRPSQHHGDNSDFMLGSSPPLFGGLNGAFSGNGYMPDSLYQGKSSGRGIGDIPLGRNGRAEMPQRGYEHFAKTSQLPTNDSLPIHIGQVPSHMEELAVGSIEAPDLPSRYMNASARRVIAPSSVHSGLEQRSSLEELAAASDAAKGGLGSATMESMRAVLALRTEFESTGDGQRGDRGGGGGYGLF